MPFEYISSLKIRQLFERLVTELEPLGGTKFKIIVGRESYLEFKFDLDKDILLKVSLDIRRDRKRIYPVFLFSFNELKQYFGQKRQIAIYLHGVNKAKGSFENLLPICMESIWLFEDADVDELLKDVMEEYIHPFLKFYYPILSDLKQVERSLNEKVGLYDFKFKEYCLYLPWHAILGTVLAKHFLSEDEYLMIKNFYYHTVIKGLDDRHNNKIQFLELFEV